MKPTVYGNGKSMRVQDLVLNQRTEILRLLCSSGSAEPVEHVTDVLLSQGELTWEDYQSIHVSGRPLHTNARQLLDVVYLKGESSCGLFLEALKQVLPEEQPAGFSFPDHWSDPGVREEHQNTFGQTLLTQRPSLVSTLQNCVDGALEALVTSAHFTSADCDGIRLPSRTPSQQVQDRAVNWSSYHLCLNNRPLLVLQLHTDEHDAWLLHFSQQTHRCFFPLLILPVIYFRNSNAETLGYMVSLFTLLSNRLLSNEYCTQWVI